MGTTGVNFIGFGTSVATLDGPISILGQGGGEGASTSGLYGVNLPAGALVRSTGTGGVTIDGTGGPGTSHNYGVFLATQVTATAGAIRVTGQGGGDATLAGTQNYGVYATSGASITSTGAAGNAATITIDGTGGHGRDNNHGVYATGGSVTSAYGDIRVTGEGGGDASLSPNSNYGVSITATAQVRSTGAV